MQLDMERFRDTFFEEAFEHLGAMENALLQLNDRGADPEVLNGVFRAAHSIKGASGAFGFTAIATLTHALENVLDRLRLGALAPSAPLTRLLLRATDQLRDLVVATQRQAPDSVPTGALVEELEAALAGAGPAAEPPAGALSGRHRVRVEFEPRPDFFLQGQDPLLLLRELTDLGQDVQVACDRGRLPGLDDLDPETCYLSWAVEMDTSLDERALREVFMFVEDACRLDVAVLSPAGAGDRKSVV